MYVWYVASTTEESMRHTPGFPSFGLDVRPSLLSSSTERVRELFCPSPDPASNWTGLFESSNPRYEWGGYEGQVIFLGRGSGITPIRSRPVQQLGRMSLDKGLEQDRFLQPEYPEKSSRNGFFPVLRIIKGGEELLASQ